MTWVYRIGLPSAAGPQAADQPYVIWPQISLVKVAGGLDLPVHITHAGDGSGRLFVVEQAGRIRIVKNGVVASTFLDIRSRVRSPRSGGGSEEGLLSVAFPSGFGPGKDHFYVYYTRLDGNNQVSRFSLSGVPDMADSGSEETILLFNHPAYSNHNGGQLAFGPDGYLYIGTGDGGGGGDPKENAQNPGSLLGKLLRIDVEMEPLPPITGAYQAYLPLILKNGDSVPDSQPPYLIPPSNPFVGQAGYREEIWALGLRNPWRFSFDRQTGDLFTGDVGQASWEEINFQAGGGHGGENYGWNIMEGMACYGAPTCNTSGLTFPVFVYPTHVAGSCSVTGGFAYRGMQVPDLQGIYVFGDYCNGSVWGLQFDGSDWMANLLLDSSFAISTFGEDEDGELYLADRNKGDIYQVTQPEG